MPEPYRATALSLHLRAVAASGALVRRECDGLAARLPEIEAEAARAICRPRMKTANHRSTGPRRSHSSAAAAAQVAGAVPQGAPAAPGRSPRAAIPPSVLSVTAGPLCSDSGAIVELTWIASSDATSFEILSDGSPIGSTGKDQVGYTARQCHPAGTPSLCGRTTRPAWIGAKDRSTLFTGRGSGGGNGGLTVPLPGGGADIYIDTNRSKFQMGDIANGTAAQVLVHETGHALGYLFPAYRDKIDPSLSNSYLTKANREGYAVTFENRYRTEHHLELRGYYLVPSDVLFDPDVSLFPPQ